MITLRSAQLGDTIPQESTRVCQVHSRDPSASSCPAPQGSTLEVTSGVIIGWQ